MEKKINVPRKMKLTKDRCRSVKVEPGKSCVDSMFQYDSCTLEKDGDLVKCVFPNTDKVIYLNKDAIESMIAMDA